MNARKKLKAWLKLKHLTLAEFGAQIGHSGTSVWRWADGRHTPRWPVLRRIYEVTDGYITPNDWLPPNKDEGRSAADPREVELAEC